MANYKLFSDKDCEKLNKLVEKTPCIIIVGCDDGTPRAILNMPTGKPEVLMEMLLSIMDEIPAFAEIVKISAIASSNVSNEIN